MSNDEPVSAESEDQPNVVDEVKPEVVNEDQPKVVDEVKPEVVKEDNPESSVESESSEDSKSNEEDKKEDEESVIETGDIPDIAIVTPDEKELDSVLEDIKKMSPTTRNNVLASLAENNNINPNNNQFSYASEKEMHKEKLRRKINQIQACRTSKKTLGFRQNKKQKAHAKRLEELKKLQMSVDASTESDNTEETSVDKAVVEEAVVEEAVVEEVVVEEAVVET